MWILFVQFNCQTMHVTTGFFGFFCFLESDSEFKELLLSSEGSKKGQAALPQPWHVLYYLARVTALLCGNAFISPVQDEWLFMWAL